MMFMTKVKIVAAITLVIAVAVAGVGTWSQTTRAGDDSLILNEKAPKEARSRGPLPKVGRLTEPLPEAKVNVGDYIAWGEKAHGLQVGIAFRRGDQESYEIGQSVTFVVYLRNVSDKKTDLSHIEPLFDEWMPVVVDAEGRRLAVAHGPIQLGMVPITHRRVEAGGQIALGYPWFRIRPLGWRGEVLGPTCCAQPGRYKVGFTGLPLRLADGKDISLGTKQVELNMRKRGTAKDDRAVGEAPAKEKQVIPAIEIHDETRNIFFPTRSFHIPFSLTHKDQEKTQEVILLVSRDQGKTWHLGARNLSTEGPFNFRAPEDGTYWFSIQLVDKQGHTEPANLNRVKPMLRICVDTQGPTVGLKLTHNSNPVPLSWEVTDPNLEENPVQRLEWSEHEKGPWNLILSGPLPSTGKFEWKLPKRMPSNFYMRIHARDKAGHDGSAVLSYRNPW